MLNIVSVLSKQWKQNQLLAFESHAACKSDKHTIFDPAYASVQYPWSIFADNVIKPKVYSSIRCPCACLNKGDDSIISLHTVTRVCLMYDSNFYLRNTSGRPVCSRSQAWETITAWEYIADNKCVNENVSIEFL